MEVLQIKFRVHMRGAKRKPEENKSIGPLTPVESRVALLKDQPFEFTQHD